MIEVGEETEILDKEVQLDPKVEIKDISENKMMKVMRMEMKQIVASRNCSRKSNVILSKKLLPNHIIK